MTSVGRRGLYIHHIGGRDGGQPFPINSRFAADYVLNLYDGDNGCEPSMHGIDGIERRVFVKCFAETTGIVDFNINYDPYTR
jgi:hypothetical protein